MNRLMTNICSDHLEMSKMFYTTLFNLEVAFDSDWFIQMIAPDTKHELGIIDRRNDIVPKDFQNAPQGFYLTFVVDDVDSVYQIAQSNGYNIVKSPHDTFYGQRRLLLKDPDGSLVDVSAPIPNFEF